MRKKPEIIKRQVVAQSRLFTVETVDLKFTNGVEATFERLVSRSRGAVMILPILGNDLLLVREYAAGVERYELGFPKGLIEGDEDILTAANREMQEEIGYGARDLQLLRTMTAAPGYINARMSLVVAQNLFPSKLPGDEPEEIEVIPWPLASIEEVLQQPDFTEARSIAAIYLLQQHLGL